MGSDDSIYEPSVSYMSEGNAGGRANKNPLPTLRVFGSSHGNVWLVYGAVVGGEQADPKDCTWFSVYYHGIMRQERRAVFGHWMMTVKGKDLDTLCGQIAAHTCPTIKPGRNENSLSPYSIEKIEFKLMEVSEA